MIVAGSASPLLLSSAGGYNLTNSLRLRSSASAYLNRTPSTAGNSQTWTWSGWVKLGTLDVARDIFSAGANASNWTGIDFRADGRIQFFTNSSGVPVGSIVWSPNVYRDPSAWYHFVIVCDTTNATQTSRFRLFVNGVQVTGISGTGGENTWPAQNATTNINTTVAHSLGRKQHGANEYFDGYLDEVNFVDGQALNPSSFGATSATTGVWQPIKYTGTYGTNGFYLPFTDNSALTTSSNVGLGRDFSGNGNYWTTNNISITAGATYDSMTDVPTLTSATAANYCTLNPLKSYGGLLDANLNQYVAIGNWTTSTSTFYVSSGKWYWEAFFANLTGGSFGMLGIVDNNFAQQTLGNYPGVSATSYGYFNLNGNKYNNGSAVAYGASYADNDLIGVALDMDAGTLTFYKNGVSQGTAYTGLTGSFTPAMGTYGSVGHINFGQRPFTYTPPTGFNRLNTFNLPTPTIGASGATLANKNFNAVLYTGNGSTNTINSVGFQPDMVWIKARSASANHALLDSVRPSGFALYPNLTNAEANNSTLFTGITSNGFGLAGNNVTYNESAATYVAWNWRANGAAVTNTAGTISAQVSANTSAGFSVVTYTGNATSGATVGHGLGVAPSFIISKNRSSGATDWPTYHISTGNNGGCTLNETAAKATTAIWWNNTTPSSTVVTLGNGSQTNGSTNSQLLYCFSPVAGYSAFGSYTGNGSADGPFVFTGFRPRWIMIKQTTSTSDWVIFDTSRDPSNMEINYLVPNAAGAEGSGSSVQLDGVSNGIKIRGTWVGMNSSGQTYIYAAFAETPQKFALAR
jgi:hypothetical protein